MAIGFSREYVVLAGLLAAVPALADTTAVYGGSPSSILLNIPVTASIGGVCGFATPPSGTRDVGELSTAFTQDFDFVLQCTGPLRVAVLSSNGALKASVPALDGYSASAPYQITLNIAGDTGVGTATATCDAAAVTASASGTCIFRGPVSTTQGLYLSGRSYNTPGSYLRVSSAGYAGSDTLVASNAYSDTLTVTLSASL